jgi:hypothetical protein
MKMRQVSFYFFAIFNNEIHPINWLEHSIAIMVAVGSGTLLLDPIIVVLGKHLY